MITKVHASRAGEPFSGREVALGLFVYALMTIGALWLRDMGTAGWPLLAATLIMAVTPLAVALVFYQARHLEWPALLAAVILGLPALASLLVAVSGGEPVRLLDWGGYGGFYFILLAPYYRRAWWIIPVALVLALLIGLAGLV
jgi:hypothetical protein